jgi:hypothetical protein
MEDLLLHQAIRRTSRFGKKNDFPHQSPEFDLLQSGLHREALGHPEMRALARRAG